MGGPGPRDVELVAAAEALEVASDDVLDALELGRRRGDRLELEDAVGGAQLAAAERERDRPGALVERDVELVAEVLAELQEVRRRAVGDDVRAGAQRLARVGRSFCSSRRRHTR